MKYQIQWGLSRPLQLFKDPKDSKTDEQAGIACMIKTTIEYP
jgi:hypothetical protein